MATKTNLRLTFCGAAQTVTGSRFLLEFDNHKVLIDCGLFQGKKELRLRNWEKPPFEPRELSAIVLTHAHIDHTGYLPLVVKQGFKGPIYCTEATGDLLNLLLPDSAHLQEEEAKYANAHGTSRHRPARPLYNVADSKASLAQLRPLKRGVPTTVVPKMVVTSTCAGHILGSVCLSVDIGGRRLTFSGDIGRYDSPLLPDPQPLDFGDILLVESTYGNRLHGTVNQDAELARIIKEGMQRGGPIIIPAFAIGRTQHLLYTIAQLERQGAIPELPVFVDSPMAIDATNIYRDYKHDYDEEAKQLIRAGETPLLTARTTFCPKVEQSKELNYLKGPRIVIAASGMVNGGRVLHHMLNWLDKEETTVLFVGFQAEGTRGQIIQSGAKEVKVFGKNVPVRAKIESISGFSAHGDRDELLRWLSSCRGSPKIVRVIHGEPEPSKAFAGALKEKFRWAAEPAKYLETIEIT